MTKHTLIETEKASVLVVDLPKHVSCVKIIDDKLFSCGGVYIGTIPPGPWISAGPLSDVKEEVAGLIVEQFEFTTWGRPIAKFTSFRYRNYAEENRYNESFDTATEALRSLVEANVKLRNPLGDKCPEDIDDLGAFTQHRRKQILAWQSEEETVYRNPFLFYESKEKK